MSNIKGLIRQSLRFGLVGMVNTAIGLAVIYSLMFFFGIGVAGANLVGYVIGLGVSFALNRLWTFNSTQQVSRVLPKYVLVAGACYLLNLGMVVVSTASRLIDPYLAQLLGIGVYTVCMFVACRWFVFAPSRYTAA